MNFLKKHWLFLITIFALTIFASIGFADEGDIDPGSFASQVIDAIKNLGGLSWGLKISSICLLIIASMKVSVLRTFFWDKLGAAKAFVAPLLGLVSGLLASVFSGGPFTWANMFAYLITGAGALILHELLDALKGLPGIGSVYVAIIDFLSKMLGAPPAKVEAKK